MFVRCFVHKCIKQVFSFWQYQNSKSLNIYTTHTIVAEGAIVEFPESCMLLRNTFCICRRLLTFVGTTQVHLLSDLLTELCL